MEIDGSFGEGGGQILRCAVALSALTGREVTMTNIRAKRGKPGLAAQHLTAVMGVATLCDGDVEGAYVGSTSIAFRPGKVLGGAYQLDVGTAGSITLVLQACLLASLHAPTTTELEVRGGTNVQMSPPVDFYSHVLVPLLGRMGYDVQLELVARGFYPQGGGVVRTSMAPCPGLRPLSLRERGKLEEVGGECFAQNLPDHVAHRMEDAVRQVLVDHELRLRAHRTSGHSTGAGTALYARYHNTVLGADGLGKKGVPAETVGEEAGCTLRREMEGPGTLDVHAADQLLPYLALASGPSAFRVLEVTEHLNTQMWLLRQFLPVRFKVTEGGEGAMVEVFPNHTCREG
ncbi:MAG: RNA 3'-terminal phosphate cyclase [Methanomassiliicoccus sp.]|nr:RNA 3'-terminal phosphate cyclase [Methanomassiliicoccus sp.]